MTTFLTGTRARATLIACAAIGAIAAGVPASGKWAPGIATSSAPQRDSRVNGWNVQSVLFGQGSNVLGGYRQNPDKSWVEFDRNEKVTFRFVEQNRDEWSVYLLDASRNVRIQIDLFRKKIGYAAGSAPSSDLYDVLDSSTGSGPAGGFGDGGARNDRSDRWDGDRWRSTYPIDVGPIWNAADASDKCRRVAREVDGEWTGQWWTLVVNKDSVCEIRFGRR